MVPLLEIDEARQTSIRQETCSPFCSIQDQLCRESRILQKKNFMILRGLLFLVGSADLYPLFKYNYVFPKIHDALPNTGIP